MTEGHESKGKADIIDAYVGKRLKMRRVMLGLSQQDLGEAVNVSIQQIQKYEKATNRISSGRLFAFAKMLMVPIDFFFSDAEISSSEGMADEKDQFNPSDIVAEKELLSLVRSFSCIKDINIRKKIVDLVKTLSDPSDEQQIG